MRCEAFVNYAPTVAGERLRPITLDSYNALVAFGNAFVTGEGIGFEDVANFVWLHSPAFGQFAREEKAQTTRRVARALTPRFPTLNLLAAFFSQFPRFRFLRHCVRPTEGELFMAAVAEIRRLLIEATGDLPTSDGEGEPLPFAFQAYVLNVFRRDLGMAFDETRAIPLKQVAEHFREILHHASGGKAILLTRDEAAIWREYLKAKAPPAKTDAAA